MLLELERERASGGSSLQPPSAKEFLQLIGTSSL